MTPNQKAFLTMIAVSEGTKGIGDDGYNVLVGSTPQRPLLFHSYADHPRILNRKLNSTAAGRYQIIAPTFDEYKKKLGLADFSPGAQDLIALAIIADNGAEDEVFYGDLADAIEGCCDSWASFPGSDDGQHEQKLAMLQYAYIAAGGVIRAD